MKPAGCTSPVCRPSRRRAAQRSQFRDAHHRGRGDPSSGQLDLGVKSNGGFHLQVGDESMQRKAFHGGSTRVVPFSFEQAGTYAVDLTYYERAPRATLELFASEGRFHRFGARGPIGISSATQPMAASRS